MGMPALLAMSVAIAAQAAPAAAQEQRTTFSGVSAVRVANYGSPSVLLKGTRQVGQLRVTAEHVVERPVEKGQSAHSLSIGEADIPHLRKILTDILPPKCE